MTEATRTMFSLGIAPDPPDVPLLVEQPAATVANAIANATAANRRVLLLPGSMYAPAGRALICGRDNAPTFDPFSTNRWLSQGTGDRASPGRRCWCIKIQRSIV